LGERFLAKSSRQKHCVQVGELIELCPDTGPQLPPDAAWQPSRPDVAVRVVEQDSTRGVGVLDGPAGAVNLALVTSTNVKPRTVCSWKFEILETLNRSQQAGQVPRQRLIGSAERPGSPLT
jgi:hypothetical protein